LRRAARRGTASGPASAPDRAGAVTSATAIARSADAAFPRSSVAVTRAVNVPGAAKAWLACAPGAALPSPNSHPAEKGDHTSLTDAPQVMLAPGAAEAGAVRLVIRGGAPS
jgi:hypothetical protein